MNQCKKGFLKMTFDNPAIKLSVLMTVYNGMPYLPDAVQSILCQDFTKFEFVIVDDGSTDGTAFYILQLQDPRIVYLRQENGGTAAAANLGLTSCRGEYLARMDADDIALPTRFSKQVKFLDEHAEIGFLGTQVAPLGEARVGRSLILPSTNKAIVESLFKGKHALCHPTLMMRTQLLKQIGGYWKLKLVDDWDMMLRMTEITNAHNLDEVLHHYRVHRGSLNGSKMRQLRFAVDYCIDSAVRRKENRSAISVTEFREALAKRPFVRQLVDSIDIYSRSQYRLAVAEILGNARLIGYARLMVAALCQPGLAFARVKRMLTGVSN